MAQLCLVIITLTTSSKSVIALLLLVTVIGVISFLRMTLTLIQLSGWSRVASKEEKKVGLGSLTTSGGRASLLKEISKTGIMNQSLSHWKDYEISIASENLIKNIRIREGTLD
jgi:hypothetical protein